MANKIYAKEWLEISYKNLATAKHLFGVNHYTDIIVIELQQTIEKALKSILAFYNNKIPRTHNLDEIASLVTSWIQFDESEKETLNKTTNYYQDDRYPNPKYCLPKKDEIKEILEFTEGLFDRVCTILDINKSDVMK